MFGILFQPMSQFAKGLFAFFAAFGSAVQVVGHPFGLKHGAVPQENRAKFQGRFGAQYISAVAFPD
jgi:hypothetical protein